jgi:ABC-type dipeptide/oligopeptide/nickel transport system permease component
MDLTDLLGGLFASVLIVLLTILGGLLLELAVFYFLSEAPGRGLLILRWLQRAPPLPSLLLAPVFLVACYQLFGVSLIYPVQMLAEGSHLIFYLLAPALLLILSSGLALDLVRMTISEIDHWSNPGFLRTARSFGKSRRRHLFWIVVPQVFLLCLDRAVVWLFAELMIIEAVFNVPGLAHLLWRYTINGQVSDFLLAAAGLLGFFAWLTLVARRMQRTMGLRLSGY